MANPHFEKFGIEQQILFMQEIGHCMIATARGYALDAIDVATYRLQIAQLSQIYKTRLRINKRQMLSDLDTMLGELGKGLSYIIQGHIYNPNREDQTAAVHLLNYWLENMGHTDGLSDSKSRNLFYDQLLFEWRSQHRYVGAVHRLHLQAWLQNLAAVKQDYDALDTIEWENEIRAQEQSIGVLEKKCSELFVRLLADLRAQQILGTPGAYTELLQRISTLTETFNKQEATRSIYGKARSKENSNS
ncbi:MAG: DUF6261 family protein [Flavobacteriaceae bacterium]|nr:DUF6261 family protein [Flavobacteriaceae bacterium]